MWEGVPREVGKLCTQANEDGMVLEYGARGEPWGSDTGTRRKKRPPGRARAMGDAWGHPFVKQGQEVLWPPIVRIPEWRGRAGGVQWPVMPSKGDAGRCRGF